MNMQAGRTVALALALAGVSAVGIALNLFDLREKFSSPNRYEYAGGLFIVFVAVVASVLYQWWRKIEFLEASKSPAIQIVFDESGTRPYLQKTLLRLPDDSGAEEWRYRVGVKNLGKTEIPHVRAVLERIEPIGGEGFRRIAKEHIYPGQPLQAMGKPADTEEFLLACSGEEPSVYVDVVHDHITDEGASKMICFAYATADMPHAAVAGTYRITIRVEGSGTYDRRIFVIDRHGPDNHLRMRAVST